MFQMGCSSVSSSEDGEYTGSPLIVSSSIKYLAGAYAWDRNEAAQR